MINLPRDVVYILEKLNSHGYDGYVVGGCVRDSLLGRTPKDWDITTNALPEIVENMFEHTIPTGKEYGTITVILNKEPFEITTYRLESDYDGRRPKAVKFSDNILIDLSRRDFTINAMCMGLDKKIIDPFDGMTDLDLGLIKCVGNAKDRISEDKLRALRAIRFASRYNFEIDLALKDAIKKTNLEELSKERIREEFNKIILSEYPSEWLDELRLDNLLFQIVPELEECYGFDQKNIHHNKNVYNHILSVMDNVEAKLELRLSALFHDIGKPSTFTLDEEGNGHFYTHHKASANICRDIMRRLKYSNVEIEYISELVYWHMSRYEHLKTSSVKKFINKVGEDKLEDLFKLQIADICASKPPFDFENVYKWKFECERVVSINEPMNVKDLEINGHDIMALGFKGKRIGDVLNYLLECVLETPDMNNKEALTDLAKLMSNKKKTINIVTK